MHLDFTTLYDIGQLVYRRADTNVTGIVIGFTINPSMMVSYVVGWSDGESGPAYECEITDEKAL